MKSQSIRISIPIPCHESWSGMDATERGAFCHSCQKEVIDFSTMTDGEVIEYLSRNKTECGRFREDQVDRKLNAGRIRNGFLKWKALALGCLSLLAFKGGFASRNKPLTIQISEIKGEADTIATPSPRQITISGKILDSVSHKALSGARITIEGKPVPDIASTSVIEYIEEHDTLWSIDTLPTAKVHSSIFSDVDGMFSLQTNNLINGRPIIIVISLDGYRYKEITIDPNQPLQNYTIDLVPLSKEVFPFIMGRM